MKVVEILGASTQGYTFFCMHGYGANAYDGKTYTIPEISRGTRFLYPDSILKIDLGYAADYEGRAWFPIDWAEIERIRREGELRDLSKTLPAGMPRRGTG